MSREILTRWLGPSVTLLAVLVVYTLWLGPLLADLRADWRFLHQAREEAIRQQLQRQASLPK